VMFEMHATDKAKRDTDAGMTDETTTDANRTTTSDGGFFGSIFGGDNTTNEQVSTNVSSAYSSTKETSSAELDAKAKLAGSVLVRFKSETFPLERIATLTEVASVQNKSQRGSLAAQPAAAQPAAPAPAPVPVAPPAANAAPRPGGGP